MSVLGHVFEQAGLTTVAIALLREHVEKVKPPRALFAPFAFGHTLGRPDDPEYQHKIIKSALDLLESPSGPVLVDFEAEEGPENLPQSSTVQPSAVHAGEDPANEVTALRAFYERWVDDHQGRTLVGLTGIPQGGSGE